MTHNNYLSNEQRALRDLSVYEPTAEMSPFSAFLDHTTEKDRVGAFLGQRLASEFAETKGGTILDIGAGDGSLAFNAISASGIPRERLDYHAVEPVAFNAERVRTGLATFGLTGYVYESTFQAFQPERSYEVIIASNLYYLATEDIPAFISRSHSMMAPNGKLMFAYRGEDDDLLRFRHTFEAPLYQHYRKPRTVRDALDACSAQGISPSKIDTVHAALSFPDDERVANRIVEFILNRSPLLLPDDYQTAMRRYIEDRGRQLVTIQAILTFG